MPLSSPAKLIVFDVDGTLVDSQNVIVTCMEQAFAAHGLPLPGAARVRSIIGLPLEIGVAQIAPDLAQNLVYAVAESYRTLFQTLTPEVISTEIMFPGMRELLFGLKDAGYSLGIATGKGKRGLGKLLVRHDLEGLFVTLQTGDVPPAKPHPAMLLRAIEEAAVAPHETVMIGDTSFDMAMAEAAGAVPVGVTWGYHPAAELTRAGAAHLIDRAEDLLPILQIAA